MRLPSSRAPRATKAAVHTCRASLTFWHVLISSNEHMLRTLSDHVEVLRISCAHELHAPDLPLEECCGAPELQMRMLLYHERREH